MFFWNLKKNIKYVFSNTAIPVFSMTMVIKQLCMLGHEIMSSEFRHVCYRIIIMGSQLSPSSKNLVSAQAGKVTIGLASHWPCVTDSSGITTYGLTALRREMSTPPTLQVGMALYLTYVCHATLHVLLQRPHIFQSAVTSLCNDCKTACIVMCFIWLLWISSVYEVL